MSRTPTGPWPFSGTSAPGGRGWSSRRTSSPRSQPSSHGRRRKPPGRTCSICNCSNGRASSRPPSMRRPSISRSICGATCSTPCITRRPCTPRAPRSSPPTIPITLLEAVDALTARALGVEGLADLDREAEEARRNLAPGWLSLRRSRDRVLVRHLDGAQAPRLDTGSRFCESPVSFGKCSGIVAARSGVWRIRTRMSGQVAENQGAIIIMKIQKPAVRAVTDRTNAPDRQAGDDFNRELADAEMSQIAGADPPDAPYYGDVVWQAPLTPEQKSRIASALSRRRHRFR